MTVLSLFIYLHVVSTISDTKGDILKSVHTVSFPFCDATVAVKLHKGTKMIRSINSQDATKSILLDVNRLLVEVDVIYLVLCS